LGAIVNSKKFDGSAVAMAGLTAGLAYVATMAAEIRLSGCRLDDLLFLGRPFAFRNNRARSIGMGAHLLISVGLATVYAEFAHNRLPGPPWARGALFAVLENAILFPLARVEKYHPATKAGEIDRYWSGKSFAWTIPRHVVYGSIMGSLYERLREARDEDVP
jgi:hypothetical protein